jgi:tRNA modification GTPase
VGCALARADGADLRLFVFDAQCPEDAAGAAQWSGKDTLLVANKIDLVPEDAALPAAGVFGVSALTGAGVARLTDALTARIASRYDGVAPVLTRARHREALEIAATALARAVVAALPELRAEDLRLAWRGLGRITGQVDVEDLLDVIFADFCLGK